MPIRTELRELLGAPVDLVAHAGVNARARDELIAAG